MAAITGQKCSVVCKACVWVSLVRYVTLLYCFGWLPFLLFPCLLFPYFFNAKRWLK